MLILIFAYGVQLGNLFLDSSGVVEDLPVLNTGTLALLAIRHSGYLTNKAVPSIFGSPRSDSPSRR